jgi:hypothetical protein
VPNAVSAKIMEEEYKKIAQDYPFLSYCKYLETEYIGIIQNCDNQLASMYIYNMLHDYKLKQHFLKCGETWWWESNRQIPINVFLKDEFKIFRGVLKTFARKEFQIIHGPATSLTENLIRRIKRRQITLVKKLG